MATLKRFFPLYDSLKSYDRSLIKGDLTAGLTVAVMLIPQGMAYAMIAGLPPIYGLYAALVPVAVYALFGTSRQLSVGPVAMVSLLVAAGVTTIAEPGSPEYLLYAISLALLVGLIQAAMGFARLGFVVNFLSHPVVSGFMSAAALIIGFSQVKHILGMSIPGALKVYETVGFVASNLQEIHWTTFVIGMVSIGLLAVLKKWNKRFPGALAVVILGIVVVRFLSLDTLGVSIVGEVPSGLPALLIPEISFEVLSKLLPIAAIIALVGFMESIAVAKSLANRHRYEVDANQELIGLGLANFFGSFFQAYPTTGGISRTAVNDQAGARTPLASLFTAVAMAFTLLFLTSLFYFLPNAVLAAIIMVAVFALIDVKEAVYLWRLKKTEFGVFVLTFLVTIVVGIEQGILVGVIASLLLLVQSSSYPHMAEVGRLPGTTHYRNILRYPEAETDPTITVIRMDASLHFANATVLRDTILKKVDSRPLLKVVILDAFAINNIDASAIQMLEGLVYELDSRNIDFYLSGVKGPVLDIVKRSHLLESLGSDHLFIRAFEAFEYAREHLSDPQETEDRESVLAS